MYMSDDLVSLQRTWLGEWGDMGEGECGRYDSRTVRIKVCTQFVSVKAEVSNRVTLDIMSTRVFNEVSWLVRIGFLLCKPRVWSFSTFVELIFYWTYNLLSYRQKRLVTLFATTQKTINNCFHSFFYYVQYTIFGYNYDYEVANFNLIFVIITQRVSTNEHNAKKSRNC